MMMYFSKPLLGGLNIYKNQAPSPLEEKKVDENPPRHGSEESCQHGLSQDQLIPLPAMFFRLVVMFIDKCSIL